GEKEVEANVGVAVAEEPADLVAQRVEQGALNDGVVQHGQCRVALLEGDHGSHGRPAVQGAELVPKGDAQIVRLAGQGDAGPEIERGVPADRWRRQVPQQPIQRRSEEHTSELQSLTNIVCRLLLEKKKNSQPAYS